MNMRTSHSTVRHGEVTIPVTRGGVGPTLVFCPGLSAPQADLHDLTGLLRRDHHVVTFDLRGHGHASAAQDYSFRAFWSDLDAVLTALDLPDPPVLVGYSLGADLAVHVAAQRPADVAALVLIDGANPLPEPVLTEADLPVYRAMWQQQAREYEARRGTARQVLLTGAQILDVNAELDAFRSEILGRYREIDCPISMIMSSAIAGDRSEPFAVRLNQNWLAGIERLVREQPLIRTSWLDADHQLVFTHAAEIAGIIRPG